MHPDMNSKLGRSCGKKLRRKITFTASSFISLSECVIVTVPIQRRYRHYLHEGFGVAVRQSAPDEMQHIRALGQLHTAPGRPSLNTAAGQRIASRARDAYVTLVRRQDRKDGSDAKLRDVLGLFLTHSLATTTLDRMRPLSPFAD
ncbi:hypothetical protein VMCG_00018 [Cytospora schulzeri]|uniref:Uncharacterized protein n=1 Tax=Cytospora schulzeri TaxID=448051 RepID=A0A423X8V9_9PEZI|nr:hypothetical protein VMCG_00018 [Valsa malicola]